MIQSFTFTTPHLTTRLRFHDSDWAVGAPQPAHTIDIIDLDGGLVPMLHPGYGSDVGKSLRLFFDVDVSIC